MVLIGQPRHIFTWHVHRVPQSFIYRKKWTFPARKKIWRVVTNPVLGGVWWLLEMRTIFFSQYWMPLNRVAKDKYLKLPMNQCKFMVVSLDLVYSSLKQWHKEIRVIM